MQLPERSRLRAFGGQLSWSLSARTVAAFLQMAVMVLLARGLPPSRFAFVSSVLVAANAVVALNGFGLLRQIQFKRSLSKNDPALPTLFALRLRFTYASAGIWVVLCLGAFGVFRDSTFIALIPMAFWLLVEQTTQVWNGLSVVDGKAQHLVRSYLTRRVPVVATLGFALWKDLDSVWAWTIGLAIGSVISYVQGMRTQEPWARILWPRRDADRTRLDLDFGYWWSQIGDTIKDFDVAAVAAIDPGVAGIYAFPARLVRPMNLVTQSTASVAFPLMARRRVITTPQLLVGTVLGSLPVTAVALFVAALAPLIPTLVGESYRASVGPMQVLCLAAALGGLGRLLQVFLQARSGAATKFAGYVTLLAAGLQIGLAVVGAVLGGAMGAAWGATVSQCLMSVALLVRSIRQCRWETSESLAEQDSISSSVRRAEPRADV